MTKFEKVDFFFVWTKRGHIPRFTHDTHASAVKEAERLATLNPGKKFIVLKSVVKVSVDGDPDV